MLDMSGGDSLKHRLMRKNNDKVQRLSAKYDKYVYLTRQMDDFYHAGDGNYIKKCVGSILHNQDAAFGKFIKASQDFTFKRL